ncbi:MAG: hypothetical protein AAFV53_08175, partial [Myxococcota bacterium]
GEPREHRQKNQRSHGVSSGCIPLGCTEIGCNGSYELTFEADVWEEGEVELSVAFDGVDALRCTFAVPSDDGEDCGVSGVTFVDGAMLVAVPTPMDERIAEADIELMVDGVVLFSDVVEPLWSDPFWPNGRRCDRDSGCLSAEDTFRL